MSTGKEVLLLRLDAPLMSFGGVLVGELGVTEPFPTLAMIAGLMGNALGLDHRQAEVLQRLQARLRYAARRDRPGVVLVDFQTVDLGQDFLAQAWTTSGVAAVRRGGTAGTATHIRHRHYWADAVFTVALRLEPDGEAPNLTRCSAALIDPERPLFLGRKPCIPSLPLVLGTVVATSLRAALLLAPLSQRAAEGPWTAWWPQASEPRPTAAAGRLVPLYDQRDWKNQVHVGRRLVWEGQIERSELEISGA